MKRLSLLCLLSLLCFPLLFSQQQRSINDQQSKEALKEQFKKQILEEFDKRNRIESAIDYSDALSYSLFIDLFFYTDSLFLLEAVDEKNGNIDFAKIPCLNGDSGSDAIGEYSVSISVNKDYSKQKAIRGALKNLLISNCFSSGRFILSNDITFYDIDVWKSNCVKSYLLFKKLLSDVAIQCCDIQLIKDKYYVCHVFVSIQREDLFVEEQEMIDFDVMLGTDVLFCNWALEYFYYCKEVDLHFYDNNSPIVIEK